MLQSVWKILTMHALHILCLRLCFLTAGLPFICAPALRLEGQSSEHLPHSSAPRPRKKRTSNTITTSNDDNTKFSEHVSTTVVYQKDSHLPWWLNSCMNQPFTGVLLIWTCLYMWFLPAEMWSLKQLVSSWCCFTEIWGSMYKNQPNNT